jgi:transposase
MTRLPMRKIREVLRLVARGMSTREMASSLRIGRTTLREYVYRARSAGLSWPLPDDLSDGDLERMLFPRAAGDVRGSFAQPDWACIHAELRRKGVTLALLWEEYRAVHPDGYGYSRFCELYRRWEGRLTPTMRQHHVAGDKLFVDYAGDTLDVVDPKTGEVRSSQLFVAALGASSYTCVEASWSQKLPDWIASHKGPNGQSVDIVQRLGCHNRPAGLGVRRTGIEK